MIKAAIEKILDLSKIEIIEHEGKKFSDKKLYKIEIDKSPQPEVLNINTLSGVIDYISIHPDNSKEYLIHIISPKEINIYGEYEELYGRRKLYLTSECISGCNFSFITKNNQIEFTTALQVYFVLDDNLKDLINIVSNITDEQTNNFIDNGISQQVTIKKGIKRESKDIINPFILRPYRTFEEIEQVESSYIFKIIKTDGNEIKFNLQEIESNLWKLDSINLIRDFIHKSISITGKIPVNIIC
jgi:hypothetical protein